MAYRIDYDGMIAVYEVINRQRSLLPHEEKRLDEIIRKKNGAGATARYRIRNHEGVLEKNRAWHAANREYVSARYKLYYAENRAKRAYQTRLWREQNPEKVEAARQKKKAARDAARLTKEKGGE